MDHCALILTKLGQAEDEIFRQRQIDEEKFKRRQKVSSMKYLGIFVRLSSKYRSFSVRLELLFVRSVKRCRNKNTLSQPIIWGVNSVRRMFALEEWPFQAPGKMQSQILAVL